MLWSYYIFFIMCQLSKHVQIYESRRVVLSCKGQSICCTCPVKIQVNNEEESYLDKLLFPLISPGWCWGCCNSRTTPTWNSTFPGNCPILHTAPVPTLPQGKITFTLLPTFKSIGELGTNTRKLLWLFILVILI